MWPIDTERVELNMTAEPVAHHRRAVNGIKMHYAEAGAGPPVVLLHGFPETWYSWRHQIEALRMRYRLIMPDLRGYGATEKPPTGYDKRTMENDIRALMASVGIERAPIIGHDRGARVGLRLAKDHPDAVARFAALDNIPTRLLFGMIKSAFGIRTGPRSDQSAVLRSDAKRTAKRLMHRLMKSGTPVRGVRKWPINHGKREVLCRDHRGHPCQGRRDRLPDHQQH